MTIRDKMTISVFRLHACTGHRAALYALAQGQSPRHFLTTGGDGWVVEWDLDDPETGKLLASVETQCFSLCSLPEQQLIVAGNMNGGLHWIDRNAPDQTRNIQHHRHSVYGLTAVKESLFSVGGDGMLTRWDIQNTRSIESLQLSQQALRCISFNQPRNELAIGSSDGSIYLLDADNLAIRHVLRNAHTNSVFTVAYSPDAQHLLSGGRDAMLRAWDLVDDYACISEQPAHLFTINHLVFSPDRNLFATASRDKTIKIWDARTFALLKVVDTLRQGSHPRSVNHLLWLPNCLISCGDDGLAILWAIIEQ